MSIELADILTIHAALAREGGAVIEQLANVLDGRPKEEQNPNALQNIARMLRGFEFGDVADAADWALEIEDYLNGEQA